MSFHSLSLPDFPSTFNSPPILPSNQNYTEDRPFPLLWRETHQPATGKEQVRCYSPHVQALSSLRQQGQKVIFRFTGIHIPWMMMGWGFFAPRTFRCSRKQEVFLHRLAGLSTGHKRCTRWLTWAVARYLLHDLHGTTVSLTLQSCSSPPLPATSGPLVHNALWLNSPGKDVSQLLESIQWAWKGEI